MVRPAVYYSAVGLGVVAALCRGESPFFADAFRLRLTTQPLETGVRPHVSTAEDEIVIRVNENGGISSLSAPQYSKILSNQQIPSPSTTSTFSSSPLNPLTPALESRPTMVQSSPQSSFQGRLYSTQQSGIVPVPGYNTDRNFLAETMNYQYNNGQFDINPRYHQDDHVSPIVESIHKSEQFLEPPAVSKENKTLTREEQLLEDIKAVVAKHYGKDDGTKITLETHLEKHLELDSLAKMEIFLELEKQHDVEIPEDKAAGVETVGHVYNEIKNLKFGNDAKR